jgi:5-methylcytosine-specific restriction endonuclease McrA
MGNRRHIETDCSVCKRPFKIRADRAKALNPCSPKCRGALKRKPAPEGMKWCYYRKHFRPRAEFPKNKSKKDGLSVECSDCNRVISGKYYQTHREEVLEKLKETRPDKKWRQENQEKCLKHQRRRQRSPEHREKARERERRTGSGAARQAKRRAQIAGTKTENISREDIIERDGAACYLCGRELSLSEATLEHVIPIARGGSHTADNLRIACMFCNQRKGAKLLSELSWYTGPPLLGQTC